VRGLKALFGAREVLHGVDIDIPPKAVTAVIGPSGCGKSTFVRCLNRMHELVTGARAEGKVTLDGEDVYAPEVDPVLLRRRVGMVFQKPNPFPSMSIRNNVLAGKHLTHTHKRGEADAVVESALRQAALWDEVKDSPEQRGLRPVGRPATAPVHRARAGGRARRAADGRALLGPGSDRNCADRGL
jgi:phosphate transport system ATP-binding protein